MTQTSDKAARTTGNARSETVGPETVGGDIFEEFRDLLEEQNERQGRLRHVQQFLTSPIFFDLRNQPLTVSDPPEAIRERKRDLDYRIRVLESLVSLLIEERDGLDRVHSAVTESPR